MTSDLVVRVSCRPDQRLRREAQLAQVLPPDVGYPPIVGYGGEIGYEWLVLKRLSGLPLSRCWPMMTIEDRRVAIRSLADRLQLIHSTAAPTLAPLRQLPQAIDPAASGATAVARLLVSIDKAGRLPNVDVRLTNDLAEIVQSSSWTLEPFISRTLIHGDLSFENVLWDTQTKSIQAVLDFEWSRPAPPDLDLDVLLRFCAYPDLHVPDRLASTTKAEDYSLVPFWLAEDYPALFNSPNQLDRCRLFAIAWDVEELLSYPPPTGSQHLDPRHPLKRLEAILQGDCHLDRMNNVGRTSV